MRKLKGTQNRISKCYVYSRYYRLQKVTLLLSHTVHLYVTLQTIEFNMLD